jgi:phage terminase large subunit
MKPTKVFFDNLKAYNDGYRLIINKGSSRSSKTFSILQCYYVINNESKKHIKSSMVSQTFPHLTDGVVYDFERLLIMEGIDPDKVHHQTKHQFALNKSIINYFSADQSGKVMGPSRNLLYLNEPNHGITFDTFVQLKTRTTETIWIDYNPAADFWLQTEGVLNDERAIVIHSTWLDNVQNLTKAQIDDFLDAKRKSKTSAYWDYYWKVYGLGQDGVLLDERIMPMLHRASRVPDDAIMIPAALDFGFHPDPTAFLHLWIRKKPRPQRDELYIKQLVYDTKLSIDSQGEGAINLSDLMQQRGHNKNHKIIAESADPRAVGDLRRAGFNIEAVRKTSVETSIRLFHDYDIFILDGSEDCWREFDNYKFKRDKKTNKILGIPLERQPDHCIDAVRYVLLSRNLRWSIK